MRELAEVEVTARNGVPVATVRGEIDLSNADSTLQTLLEASGPGGLVLDLSGLDYLDSAGVRVLFKLEREVEGKGGRLRAVVPEGATVRRVLELANLERELPFDASVEQAVEALS
jgi:anti-anti-sigma factor